MKTKPFLTVLMIAFPFFLASCGSSTAPTVYSIGGNVAGLNGTGLVLQYNGGSNLSVTSNGQFQFANDIDAGGTYSVTVLTQPSNPVQTCTVTSGGMGTANSDIVIVEVACVNNTFTVGGNVSGLTGTGLVLQDNGGSNLTVNANGSFSFPTQVQRGSNYNVTILTQPSSPAQACAVSNGVGANITGNVTAIQVTCFNTTVTYTIGGTVSGLSGTGLVLQDNSGDNLPIGANGTFTFATAIPSGANYSVTVLAQPSNPPQNCVVAGGGGTAVSNVTGILVTCTTSRFPIGGTVTGLTGSGLVLQDNGGDNLAVSAGATGFTFATPVVSGASYAVTVLTQPTGSPSCSIGDGSGSVTNAAISNVAVNCTGATFNISATVTGLPANTSLVLQDNGGDNLTITANSLTTNFNTPIATGSAYAVTVLTQPAGATCTPGTNASGKVASANIDVAVTCGDPITSGNAHVCAITGAGGVACWGANDFGQLGDGTTVDSSRQVQVVGLSGVVSVAAGYDSTCALTGAGVVWCWGDNSSGQLGNGTLEQSSVPVQVMDSAGDAPLSGIVTIAAGRDHACAVTAAGEALCWGDNSAGELGTGDFTASKVPMPVVGMSAGVATISAGSDFSCAVTTAGSATCWGEGESGQLGSGTTSSSDIPVAVLDISGKAPLGSVVTISAGVEDACALMSDGTVLCWGANNSGQLGNPAAGAQSSIPVAVTNTTGSSGQAGLSGIVAVKGGLDDSCAVTSDGAAVCWGLNANRGLLGGNAGSPAAKLIPWLQTGVAAIATGYKQTCALTTSGSAVCWAYESGQPSQ